MIPDGIADRESNSGSVGLHGYVLRDVEAEVAVPVVHFWTRHGMTHLHDPSALMGGTNPRWTRCLRKIKGIDGAARED